MNLSAWIDLQGLYVELPLIVPFTPERWTLPSLASICMCAANIVPVIVVIQRRRQGKRFSEIPYIYLIIIVGILACFVLAFFWHKTIFLFGQERSVWLLSCIFILSTLDCTSSLVFFDYMKRFRTEYLRAVFLGESLTSAIPTVLILAQGVGGETICVQDINGTMVEPQYTQPRFSVRIFMFCIAIIIIASLIAFVILRWTNIVALADATEPVEDQSKSVGNIINEENVPMVDTGKVQTPSKPTQIMSSRLFMTVMIFNTITSTIFYGCLPSLSTYALLPFGQAAFYYWSVLVPSAYPLALVVSLFWKSPSNPTIIILSVLVWIIAGFIFVIASQSPCPWLADSIQGAVMIITIWLMMSLISSFVHISVGNRIKSDWKDETGMFYYGGTAQLGMFLGSIPMFLLINIFPVFTDRKPCQTYCVS